MKHLTRGQAPEPLISVNTILSYGLGDIDEPLIATLDDKLWREVGHKSFASLVYAERPYGWAISKSVLLLLTKHTPFLQERVKAALSDKEVTPFEVDQNTKVLHSHGSNQHTAESGGSNTTSSDKRGNEYLTSRLARDNPELHGKLRNGELTANQAAIKAGIRKAMMTIPQEPVAAAIALKRRYSKTEIDILIAELTGQL